MRVSGYLPEADARVQGAEYTRRNRYFVTIGTNHIETWVGRDLRKYISGLYWRTGIGSDLVKRHGVDDLSVTRGSVERGADGFARPPGGGALRALVEGDLAAAAGIGYRAYSDVVDRWP